MVKNIISGFREEFFKTDEEYSEIRDSLMVKDPMYNNKTIEDNVSAMKACDGSVIKVIGLMGAFTIAIALALALAAAQL